MKRGYGLRKEPIKLLDYCGAFRTGDVDLPESFILPSEFIPDVRDQGRVNSCVGFATTNIMQILNQKETGIRKRFSPGYVYGKCRDDTDNYEGMIMTRTLEYLIKTGACLESDFPDNIEMTEIRELVSNRPDLDEKAKPYKIKNFETYAWAYKKRLYEDIKKAIYQYQVPILASTDYFGGSHAVCIIGWDNKLEEFIIMNSWGRSYGDNGIGNISYDSIDEACLLIDDKNSNIIMPFKDVTEDKWYYKAITHVYNAGLMNGTSEDTFDPDKPLTRAEMAQILVNLAKKEEEVYASRRESNNKDNILKRILDFFKK